MDIDTLDDAKAFDLLCGTDAERQQACTYYFHCHKRLVTGCVRQKFPSLAADLVATAVHAAFIKFFESAVNDTEFDPEKPERLIVKIAIRKACDLFRQRTHRGKYKEQSLDVISDAMKGTETSVDWAEAVGSMRAREIQELFRAELVKFAPRQRNIARLMIDRIEEDIGPTKLAELYRQEYNEHITVLAAGRARDEVRKKFKECLRQKGDVL